MTAPDELTYERAAERIARIILVLTALGTAVAFAAWGWQWGAGFLLGSLISGLNYRWLRRLVDAMGGGQSRSSLLLAFRYLFLAGGAYVILRFSSISLPAVFAGVFVLTAAVIVEAIIEIVYARK